MRKIKFRAWDNHEQVWLRRNDALFLSANTRGIHNLRIMDGEPVVVMQYTGLKDKNGVEIYEGDVLRGPTMEEQPRKVDFDEGCFWLGGQAAYEWPHPYLEVIGNIYSNPELLGDTYLGSEGGVHASKDFAEGENIEIPVDHLQKMLDHETEDPNDFRDNEENR